MSFLLNALLYLLFASLTPEASAVIVVVHHTGLSDTTRIIIIVGMSSFFVRFRSSRDQYSDLALLWTCFIHTHRTSSLCRDLHPSLGLPLGAYASK
jgi:hypothetical protein